LTRLPIRVRLTLPFAFAMFVVLAALGAFIYMSVGSALLTTADQALRAQGTEATSHLDEQGPLLDRDSAAAGIGEIVTAGGSLRNSSPGNAPPLLDAATRAHVIGGGTALFTTEITGLKGRWRVLAVPGRSDEEPVAVVVARSLGSRDETLDHLRHWFLFSAPAALLLATLGGYLLAAAALRPVEAIRRRAAAISPKTPGQRLPVPPGGDELSRLAETLNEMLARLESAFEHERRFVSDASHELRTPLALLRTELELALRRERTRDELEDALRSAAEETERLTRLAEDLLLIARSDQGSLPVRAQPTQTRTILTAVAERFAGRARELGRTIEVERPGDAVVTADPERLEQALGNLVDNALVHGAGAVRLAVVTSPTGIELHVRDEGTGFPSGFAARAFDRFSRADEARGRGGAGLGLSIVRAIVEAHGGTVGIGSGGSGGGDVWLSLPLPPG